MDNRLHTQGTLHPHHNQGGTQVLEPETSVAIGSRANTRWSNYHPDYGFPDSHRAEIISCAQTLGIPLAAIAYNVGRSTIYRWLAHQATKQPQPKETHQ
jgi:hypothetical protein